MEPSSQLPIQKTWFGRFLNICLGLREKVNQPWLSKPDWEPVTFGNWTVPMVNTCLLQRCWLEKSPSQWLFWGPKNTTCYTGLTPALGGSNDSKAILFLTLMWVLLIGPSLEALVRFYAYTNRIHGTGIVTYMLLLFMTNAGKYTWYPRRVITNTSQLLISCCS